jgi:hypothetical protein
VQDYEMPANITATTSMAEAIQDAQYAVHAVPVQHSRAFLASIKDVLPPHVPIICVSKGLEVGTGKMMSEIITGALGRKQPAVFLSGPSFAKEVMDLCPTGVVAACKVRCSAGDINSKPQVLLPIGSQGGSTRWCTCLRWLLTPLPAPAVLWVAACESGCGGVVALCGALNGSLLVSTR